jgi:glycerophosphoryl diester phosphodiesterase
LHVCYRAEAAALCPSGIGARALSFMARVPGAPGRSIHRPGAGWPLLLLVACAPATPAPRAVPGPVVSPIIIAHRGASGHRPEHTLAAYELAIAQGADFIEPDLVITRDSVLIARHEHRLDETTDVAERYPSRRTRKVVYGDTVAGWFVEDFSYAEIQTLRARERLPARSLAYDGQFGIPSFEQIIALVERVERDTGRRVGIYPETKSPAWFRSIGLPLEEPLVAALRRHKLDRADAPVFIQSFETGNLRRLRDLTPVPLIQLLDVRGGPADNEGLTYAAMATPAGLRAIREYAHGIGAHKELVLPTGRGAPSAPTSLVADVHAAGLVVHVWTLRSDAQFLPRIYNGSAAEEYLAFARAGVDGIFTDFPDDASRALVRRQR